MPGLYVFSTKSLITPFVTRKSAWLPAERKDPGRDPQSSTRTLLANRVNRSERKCGAHLIRQIPADLFTSFQLLPKRALDRRDSPLPTRLDLHFIRIRLAILHKRERYLEQSPTLFLPVPLTPINTIFIRELSTAWN